MDTPFCVARTLTTHVPSGTDRWSRTRGLYFPNEPESIPGERPCHILCASTPLFQESSWIVCAARAHYNIRHEGMRVCVSHLYARLDGPSSTPRLSECAPYFHLRQSSARRR